MKVKQLIGGLCLLFFFSIVISDNVFADWNFLQRKGLGGAFAQNDIYFYDPCDGNFNSGKTSTIDGGCAKLSELRTAMWNAASEADRENFMFVVSGENDTLAGVEGYMNQAIAHSGNLANWLDNQCKAFRGERTCRNAHEISEKEQKWIDKALAGSNVTNFADGNASWYGNADAGINGKLTCIWVYSDNEDGGECKDVDYSSEPYHSSNKCSTYITAAGGSNGNGWECWGWDAFVSWSDSMSSQCGGSQSVGFTTIESSDESANEVKWDDAGWITGGMDGYTKEVAPDLNTEYDSGKPNKIVLHYTQGETSGLAAYPDKQTAAHFTIDLLGKKVSQHYPLSKPSGALTDSADKMDNVQIEIVGYGFQADNPDNPTSDSKCVIDGVDYTSSSYCFAKFGADSWNYLGKLLTAINKWGNANGANIPLTTPVSWKGDVNKLRMAEAAFKKATGILAHMHVPGVNNHNDTGNIWPFVEAALGRNDCNLSSNENSISGARNAEKQYNEVGRMWFGDGDRESMKTLLENYGDLAYRTGQAYGVPWVVILVQGRYEDPESVCGKNNFWGIGCSDDNTGPGEAYNYANLGEGFNGYGETVHNGYYEEALKYPDDPIKYIEALELTWIGTGNRYSMQASVESLQEYINSAEGQAVVAQFGAANCGDSVSTCSNYVGKDASGLQALVKEWAYPSFGRPSDPKPAYAEAMKKSKYTGSCEGEDCGAFVYNLIYQSGWDTDYVAGNTAAQVSYLRSSEKWEDVTSSIKGNSDAKPGDVIICRNDAGIVCVGSGHHVLIYVGDVGFDSPMASASQCDYWPTSDWATDISSYINDGYHVFRNMEGGGGASAVAEVLNSWGESLMFRQCGGSCDSRNFGATSACGLIATTMAIAILNDDQDLTPMAVSQKIKSEVSGWHDYGNGNSDDIKWWALRESAPKLYGLRSGEVFTGKANASKINALRSHLQSGHLIVASISEKNGVRPLFLLNTGGPTRTRSSHAIMFYKYENGKYWVKDSAPSVKVSSIGYTEEELYDLFRANSSVWWFGH